MRRNHRKRLALDLYDVSRISYINELTQENEELREENEQLVKLLVEMPAMQAGEVVETLDGKSYEEARRNLANAAAELLAFRERNRCLMAAARKKGS